MSGWSSTYLLAGMRLEIMSAVGDPTLFLPREMRGFASPHPEASDFTVFFRADERAEADPLRRFFPPQYALAEEGEGFSFHGKGRDSEGLGSIWPHRFRAEMGLPHLDRPWRIPEEEEAVREAMQAFVKACLQCLLLEKKGTLMHAAGVSWGGGGYAFTGHTRSGKTTISREFPSENVLGDDLVAVLQGEESFTLYGTPWPGREGGTVAYGGVPLRAVFNLRPELDPGLHSLTAAEALAELAANAPRLGFESEESKLLGVFSSLATAVPIFRLSLRLGDDVLPFLAQAAPQEGEENRSARP